MKLEKANLQIRVCVKLHPINYNSAFIPQVKLPPSLPLSPALHEIYFLTNSCPSITTVHPALIEHYCPAVTHHLVPEMENGEPILPLKA